MATARKLADKAVLPQQGRQFGDELLAIETARLRAQRKEEAKTVETERAIEAEETTAKKSGGKLHLPKVNPGSELGFLAGTIGSFYLFETLLDWGLLQKIPPNLQFFALPLAVITTGLAAVGLGWVGMKAWDAIRGKASDI